MALKLMLQAGQDSDCQVKGIGSPWSVKIWLLFRAEQSPRLIRPPFNKVGKYLLKTKSATHTSFQQMFLCAFGCINTEMRKFDFLLRDVI